MPNHAKAIEAAARALAPHMEGGREFDQMPKDRLVQREWFRQGMCAVNDANQDDATAAATETVSAFLRTVEASPAMIEAGPRAYAEHFSSHTGPAVFGESMAEAFQAMSATLANEVEQG